jgi:hypothetical protein
MEPNKEKMIRLTREELTGSHVDDLVLRYKSMLGDSSISRSARRWYLRNWFLFGIMGCLGAFVAWIVLEPFFEDSFYVQGKLETVERPDDLPRVFNLDQDTILLKEPCTHYVTLRDDTIWISAQTKIRAREKNAPVASVSQLYPGREVGIYATYFRSGFKSLILAEYITLDPVKNPPQKAYLTFERLNNRSQAAGFLLFPLIAGFIGLFIGAIDGMICRLPRRALLGGGIGLIVGFTGGFISAIVSGIIYMPFNHFASQEFDITTEKLSTFGFVLQVLGRTLAWAVAGMAMGLGQGAALRSKRLLLYGFLGGTLGGMIGGLLFDPINLLLFVSEIPQADLSRLVVFMVIGLLLV